VEELYPWKDRIYAFVGIRLDHYLSDARQLSPRWNTVTLPTARFRHLARPVAEFFGPPSASAERLRMAPNATVWTSPAKMSG
jgi:hypothetical protein